MEEQRTLAQHMESFLPQLKICKKKIYKKMDQQAEKLQKYKLYKAKVQKNLDLQSQQYSKVKVVKDHIVKFAIVFYQDIIESDLESLQERMQIQNAQFLKGKVSELKALKEDTGRLLEVFVYIQTGKENTFETVKTFLQKQNTIDLNLNFMDYGSIDLEKVQDVWQSRFVIQRQIFGNKALSKHTVILKQILDWVLAFYETVIKQEILSNIESSYQEFQEKKETYTALFTKNEFIYKYYRQLHQQLQNYIEAIQQHNPLIDESFAESLVKTNALDLNITKLIEEIFKKDRTQTPEDEVLIEEEDNPEEVEIPSQQISKQRKGQEPKIFLQSTQNVFIQSPSKDNSDAKLVTIADNKSEEREGHENTSFKKLLSDQNGIIPKIRLEKENKQEKNNMQPQVLETQGKQLIRKRSNSSHSIATNNKLSDQESQILISYAQTRLDSESTFNRQPQQQSQSSVARPYSQINNDQNFRKDNQNQQQSKDNQY